MKTQRDGSDIIADLDSTGFSIARYYRGINPVAMDSEIENEVYYYHYDEKGSITKLTSSIGDEVYNYDAFGNQPQTDNNTVYNPLRYNGQYIDEETGLIYLRNRYYDPSIGRFTQEDPAKDGLNWYVYCGNDPVNFVDTTGMYPESVKDEVNKIQAHSISGYLDKYVEIMTRYEERNKTVILNVPKFIQPENSNLCWVTVGSMIEAYYRGDNIDRTIDIANLITMPGLDIYMKMTVLLMPRIGQVKFVNWNLTWKITNFFQIPKA